MSYRFALIGCGNIARRHARAMQEYGSLQAVCDPLITRAQDMAREFNVPAFTDSGKLFAAIQPDIAVICSPNGWHARHAIAALQAGCHVLCEKPMALRSADGRQMIEAAELAGKKLFVVKQNRYNLPVQIAHSLVANSRLGRISSFQVNCFWHRPAAYYHQSWRGTMALDGGTLFTQFSHFIDLLYWFLGMPKQICGYRSNAQHQGIIEFEDEGAATMVMENGAIGSLNYTLNAHQQNMEGSFTLFGPEGTIKIGGAYLDRMEHFNVAGLDYEDLVQEKHGIAELSTHHQVYKDVIRSLQDPQNYAVDATEALKSVEMIEQIYQASPMIADKKTGQHGG